MKNPTALEINHFVLFLFSSFTYLQNKNPAQIASSRIAGIKIDFRDSPAF
jgi:hypothetical protein